MTTTYALTDDSVARVLSETRQDYLLGFRDGHTERVTKTKSLPSFYVGDVVAIDQQESDYFHLRLVERKNKIVKARNTTAKSYHFSEDDHILATNVDQLFIVMALDQNFSLSKLERYLLVFNQDNLDIVVVLTKKDLVPDYQEMIVNIQALYPQIRLVAISIYDQQSIEDFQELLKKQQIGLFVGSSGAGKSSLVNHLQSDYVAKVNAVKGDHKGKHTTTSSVFIDCPDMDYYVIDTPGFKAIESHYDISTDVLFGQIEELAKSCKFSNCQHTTEPNCAVKQALADSDLDAKLFDRYLYQREKLDLLSKRRKSWRL